MWLTNKLDFLIKYDLSKGLLKVRSPIHSIRRTILLQHVPLIPDTCLSIQRQRTVYRLTLVKAWNVEEMQAYSELIALGQPDFVEVKVGSAACTSYLLVLLVFSAVTICLCTELNEIQPLRDSMMHFFIYSCSVSWCTLCLRCCFFIFYYRIHSNSIVPFFSLCCLWV